MTADLIQMGFPTLITANAANPPSLCACHSKMTTHGFICPKCNSKLCDVPMDCVVCMLTVVASPHIARSYRHLFPVSNWTEVSPSSRSANLQNQSHCAGCDAPFPPISNTPTTDTHSPNKQLPPRISQTGRYECPRCHLHFCLDCDVYVHESLGVCPGCET